jgi:hypothetical protein
VRAFVENAAVLTALALAYLVLSPSLTRLTPLVAGGVFFDARAKVRFCDFGEAAGRWYWELGPICASIDEGASALDGAFRLVARNAGGHESRLRKRA